MSQNPIDVAIAKLDAKIAVLTLAKQELEAVKDKAPATPKTRKPRQQRRMPAGEAKPLAEAKL